MVAMVISVGFYSVRIGLNMVSFVEETMTCKVVMVSANLARFADIDLLNSIKMLGCFIFMVMDIAIVVVHFNSIKTLGCFMVTMGDFKEEE